MDIVIGNAGAIAFYISEILIADTIEPLQSAGGSHPHKSLVVLNNIIDFVGRQSCARTIVGE